ncbi:M14 family metallopeptidase [Neptunicella marina]|uniref:Succinylglutamate desuccinylase/aspartoacylase family protein n=1 Tax=Neptunicella marina TaxID=2125989 RepID=A0A8J6IPN1_9ALTE|nr:M14 family metallopeptidase [Neptunicella marina]MBC3764324.1 succinylglutamate desuccinylase/aspartoacylase family protein [Neptunicella marina]
MRVVLFFTLLLANYVFSSSAFSACQFDNIQFNRDFSAARLSDCEKLTDKHYLLSILPEKTDVNPSPWFSFKLHKPSQTALTLTLDFGKYRARYLPKISNDNGYNWHTVKFDVEKNKMTFTINDEQSDIWVTAQPPVVEQDYLKFEKDLVKQHPYLKKDSLGKSVKGRDITALISTTPDSNNWLVMIGRQHPPETTGAIALQAFTQTLLNQNNVATKFNILLVPLVNPDGVNEGNWRSNVNGIDLNRDWYRFSQPETKAIRDKLQQITTTGGKIVFALDFHSTYEDVFYTMPDDKINLSPSGFTDKWLDDVQKRTRWTLKLQRKAGYKKNSGVFKQYIADTYGVHAVTYEVADNNPPARIDYIAREAAKSLAELLNKTF